MCLNKHVQQQRYFGGLGAALHRCVGIVGTHNVTCGCVSHNNPIGFGSGHATLLRLPVKGVSDVQQRLHNMVDKPLLHV